MDLAAVCADCGAKDPEWASLNRCVLICSECCHVHRNLGTHVSRVRSLKHGVWSKEQLELIRFLYASGSNNIWEHSLLDPSSANKAKIKPTASDAVIPTKENYIKGKYSQLIFALKPSRDESSLEDLNRQLWSCVRTDRVETTLRLLALGADVNYVDPEKHNSPLHVAAKENQALQVELLVIYGADPSRPNAGDLSAIDVARLENHNDLALRLEELQFEITDRLSLFLCGRRPDHSRQVHFLVPELLGNFQQRMTPDGEIAKVRREMSKLSGVQLEKIAQDIYDEVDRRDVVRAWNATHNLTQNIDHGVDQFVAVFLPPNPKLSATRNQLRQKLAKYDTPDFATLIIDVLTECKRRFYDLPAKCDEHTITSSTKTRESSKVNSANNSEDPSLLFDDRNRDYDEVAESPCNKSRSSNAAKHWSDGHAESEHGNHGIHPDVTLDDYLELKEKLNDSAAKVQKLTSSNVTILRHLSTLQESLTELKNDNLRMRNELKSQRENQLTLLRRNPSPTAHMVSPSTSFPPNPAKTTHEFRGSDTTDSLECNRSKPFGIYAPINRTPTFGGNFLPRPVEKFRSDSVDVPFMSKYADPLIRETEVLTGAIRNLLSDAQSGQLPESSVSHACTISRLIQKIVALIPEAERTRKIEQVMSTMVEASVYLTDCCSAPSIDSDATCSAAYNLAKSVKEYLKLATGQE